MTFLVRIYRYMKNYAVVDRLAKVINHIYKLVCFDVRNQIKEHSPTTACLYTARIHIYRMCFAVMHCMTHEAAIILPKDTIVGETVYNIQRGFLLIPTIDISVKCYQVLSYTCIYKPICGNYYVIFV